MVVECHRHHAPVRSVDISADGHWVASGSEDHTVRIWDRTTSLHRTLRQHRDWVRAVCFLGDGERVASASEDETTVIWSLKEAQPILWIALPHPYQGTSIREVRGLTQAQRSALLALGCNEEPRSLRAISVTEAAGSKIALRQLTREDWHVLRDLRLRALRDAPEAFAQSLAATEALTEMEWRQQAITLTEANYCIALLAFHEQPIGIIEMSVDHLWQNAGYLGGMWVAPEARRTGVGSRLLEKGLEILQQWGLAHVRFCVARHQLHAISLYRRFGFRETGVQKPLPSNTKLRSSKWRRHSPKASGTLEVRAVGLRCDIAALYRKHLDISGRHSQFRGFPGMKPWAEPYSNLQGTNHPESPLFCWLYAARFPSPDR